MAQSNDLHWTIKVGILGTGTGLALFGGSAFIGAVRGGTEFFAGRAAACLRWATVICAAGISVGSAIYLPSVAYQSIFKRLDEIERRNKELAEKLRNRAPSIIAVVMLWAECALIVTEKLMDDPHDTATAGDVTNVIGLGLWFTVTTWMSHSLVASHVSWVRWCGAGCLALIFAAPFAFVTKKFGVDGVLGWLGNLPMSAMLGGVVTCALLLLAPVLVWRANVVQE